MNYLVNNREYTLKAAIKQELELEPAKNYLFDLSYLGILECHGDKTIEFLQGQLTCDLRLLSDSNAVEGAQCNLKGRILSLLSVVSWQGIKLVLPIDLLDVTTTSLIKTAQLSRVSISANPRLKIYGFYLQNPTDIMPLATPLPNSLYGQLFSENFCCYHLGDNFYIFILDEKDIEAFAKPFEAVQQFIGSLSWHKHRLASQHIEIYPESRGVFLPHRLELQNTPLISFSKGCYKGQEIIARTHYKAKLKHELKSYIINTCEKLYSGQKLFKLGSEIEVGELIDYCIVDENKFLIIACVLKTFQEAVQLEGHSGIIKVT